MSETRGSKRTLRSIGAVLVGLFVIFVLSLGTDVVLHATGLFPPWFQPMAGPLFVLALAYRCAYTWNAGPEFGPKWYPLALVASSLPCAWLGGKLRRETGE